MVSFRFDEIEHISGVPKRGATFEDMQRYFKCRDGQHASNLIQDDCNDRGIRYPVTCSQPPCNNCNAFPGKNFTRKVGVEGFIIISLQSLLLSINITSLF